MTVFDFEEDKGVWFDMDGGGRVQLRTLTPSDWLTIRKATIKKEPVVKKIDGGKHQLFQMETVDEDAQMVMIHDLSIVSWENLFDANEKPIPVTKENKTRLMMMKDKRFRDFVTEKLAVLNEVSEDQKEASEKN